MKKVKVWLRVFKSKAWEFFLHQFQAALNTSVSPSCTWSLSHVTLLANRWALTLCDLLRLFICLWVVKERILSCGRRTSVCRPWNEALLSFTFQQACGLPSPPKGRFHPCSPHPFGNFHFVSPTENTKSSLSAKKNSKPFKSCPAFKSFMRKW